MATVQTLLEELTASAVRMRELLNEPEVQQGLTAVREKRIARLIASGSDRVGQPQLSAEQEIRLKAEIAVLDELRRVCGVIANRIKPDETEGKAHVERTADGPDQPAIG